MSGKIQGHVSLNSEKNQAFISYFTYTCVLLEEIQLHVHTSVLLNKPSEFGVAQEITSQTTHTQCSLSRLCPTFILLYYLSRVVPFKNSQSFSRREEIVSSICSQVVLLPCACIRTHYGHAEVKLPGMVWVCSWRACVALKSFSGMCFIPEMLRYLATHCQPLCHYGGFQE